MDFFVAILSFAIINEITSEKTWTFKVDFFDRKYIQSFWNEFSYLEYENRKNTLLLSWTILYNKTK